MQEIIQILEKSNYQLNLREEYLGLLIFSLNSQIATLEQLSSLLTIKSKELNFRSNNLIGLIREFKSDLINIYEDLKILKKDMIAFQNYEGKIKNDMCKNTEYEEKEGECDSTKLSKENIQK